MGIALLRNDGLEATESWGGGTWHMGKEGVKGDTEIDEVVIRE